MIFRGHRVIIPRGSDRLQAGDHIYIVVTKDQFEECLQFMGLTPEAKVRRVFILGGKQIGIEMAHHLEKSGVKVKLFEKDLSRCEKISTLVKRTVVIHGDGTDQKLLAEENVEGIDAYMALTGHDEDNIIDGAIIGAIACPKGDITVPRGEAIIKAGDRVIFFCLETVVQELESAFITDS